MIPGPYVDGLHLILMVYGPDVLGFQLFVMFSSFNSLVTKVQQSRQMNLHQPKEIKMEANVCQKETQSDQQLSKNTPKQARHLQNGALWAVSILMPKEAGTEG